ncbi:MAG: glutaredoxin domain-containing protein, partial [Patescibacteria group bacterium]
SYEEHDVAADEKAREEMIAKSQQMGVPMIDINGTIIIGFNRPEIDKALGL